MTRRRSTTLLTLVATLGAASSSHAGKRTVGALASPAAFRQALLGPNSSQRATHELASHELARHEVAVRAIDELALQPDLRNAGDPRLQSAFDRLLAAPVLQRAIGEERFAAALVDITDLRRPRLAVVNGDLMMYAASLPKIAILLGVFERAQEGALRLDDATLDSATRMIRSSSNSAATAMYEAVEPAELARILQSPRYRLYDADWGGGLWVGKPYAKKTTWKRDPIANLSHGATAFQVARFFYLLELGELVSPESARQMKKILGKPAIRHKFVKGLRSRRPGSRIFRKSGSWRTYHSDAGIVERNGRSYIAVMLANDPRGGEWLSRLIVGFDDLVHRGPRAAVDLR